MLGGLETEEIAEALGLDARRGRAIITSPLFRVLAENMRERGAAANRDWDRILLRP